MPALTYSAHNKKNGLQYRPQKTSEKIGLLINILVSQWLELPDFVEIWYAGASWVPGSHEMVKLHFCSIQDGRRRQHRYNPAADGPILLKRGMARALWMELVIKAENDWQEAGAFK